MPDRDPLREREELSDAELDALSAYSEQDIDEAVAQWDADASPEFKGLLDAPTVNDAGFEGEDGG